MKTAEDIINEKGRPNLHVTPDATVRDALKAMTAGKVGAILVKEGDEVVGIWTERDLMKNTLAEGFDAGTAAIGELMSEGLKYAPHSASIYTMMDMFLGLRMRHLLIEKGGKFIGLLSAGDVMRACLEEKSQELKDLNAIVGWKYYEDWGWHERDRSS